jgi:uncharacterized protein
MVSPKLHRRIFLDSSVLYAAAFSVTGPARRLLLKGLEGSVSLVISDLVLEDTKRNLTKNAPQALPYFSIIADLLAPQIIRPTKAAVLKAAQIVHLKDAPIVAAAAKANAEYLATHDVKHLLAEAQVIEQAYGHRSFSCRAVTHPDELILTDFVSFPTTFLSCRAHTEDTFGFLLSSIKCTTTLREVELDNSPSAITAFH